VVRDDLEVREPIEDAIATLVSYGQPNVHQISYCEVLSVG
jgi:hypothetical protein